MIPSIVGSSNLLAVQVVLIITRSATGGMNQVIAIPVDNLGQVLVISLSVPGRQCIGGRVCHRILLEDGRVLLVGVVRVSIGVISSVIIALMTTISLCSDLVIIVVVIIVVGVDVVGRESGCGEGVAAVTLLALTSARRGRSTGGATRIHALENIKGQIAGVASLAS